MKIVKFTPVTAPEDVDLYTIYEEDGEKRIEFRGYFYDGEEGFDEYNDGRTWRLQEFKRFDVPLEEFLEGYAENDNYVVEEGQNYQQYIGGLTPEEAAEYLNTYFCGEGPDGYLGYDEITMDTPCGNYAC